MKLFGNLFEKKKPKSDYRIGFFFAKMEHIFEDITNVMLVASVVVAAINVYLSFYFSIARIVMWVIVATALLHMVARICHHFERKYLKRR